MGIQWPKQVRVLAREGFDGDAVIVAFRATSTDGGSTWQPVARVIAPDGAECLVAKGLSASTDDQREHAARAEPAAPDRQLAVVPVLVTRPGDRVPSRGCA